MGKPRKVRAQRKFAQGAYVPPQSTPVSTPTQVTVNATHRAVSTPGPVTKNVCSATDLLTRMSLGKAHSHIIDWPIVILKDCVKNFDIESDNKKLGLKKRLSRRLLLRNAGKHLSDVGDYDSTDIDSEDTPLSHLLNPRVTPSKLGKNVPVRDTEGTTSRTAKTDIDKDYDHVNPSSSKIRPKRTTNGNTQQIESKKKFGLNKVKKMVVERQGLEGTNILIPSPALTEPPKTRSLKRDSKSKSSSRKSNCLPSSPGSKLLKNRATLVKRSNMKRTGVKRTLKKSRLKSLQAPVKTTRKTSVSNKKREEEKLFMAQLAKDQPLLQVLKTIKSRLHIERKVTHPEEIREKLKKNEELVNDNSDLKDNNRALEDIHDENDDSMVHKLVISNIKTLNEDLQISDSDSDATDTFVPNLNYASKDLDVPIQPKEDIIDINVNSPFDDLDTTIKPEELIIDLDMNYPFNDLDMGALQPEPDMTNQNVNYLCIDLDKVPIQPEQPDIIDLSSYDSSEVPSMPARLTRHAEQQCPLQDIADLHELLSSDVACDTCRRCMLITKYNQILKKMPKTRVSIEGEYLRSCPFRVGESSSSFEDTRRKTCKLLTSKKLIIWLINPQLDFDNTRGLDMEYATDSLKQKLNIISEDDVNNVICRINYLIRCIVDQNRGARIPKLRLSEIDCSPSVYVDSDDDEIEEPSLVYYPTLDEFKDPIAYIKSIQKKASKNGICKIIPPGGFHVPCHLDEDCVFGTTNQYLSRLFHRWGPNTREFATIQTSMTSLTPEHKERFTKAPLFGGIEVDLVKLYRLILEEGGIQGHLSRDEKWARIAAKMNLVNPSSKLDWKKLENIYCKHVLPYESLTIAEREAFGEKVDKIWEIRRMNSILRANQPLHYQHAMLSKSNVPEYEERDYFELDDLYDLCKPIFDKIEECTGKGRSMDLATFRRISKKIEVMLFPNGVPSTTKEIEKKYWEILNLRNEHLCVLSAFIDTSVDRLGHESDPKKRGGSHPWNLKRIGENPNNILHSLGKALSVTVPTLCLNQMFSTSCWHTDPHKLAWMDYMHKGATKIWYSVPDTGAPVFRNAVKLATDATVQEKRIWLASDTTMVPPSYLLTNGVPIKRIEQNPNEFIVVFPGAYASSISTGFSVAESIYFEDSTWLDHVEKIFGDLHKDCEPAMFSSVRLIMNIGRNPKLTPEVSKTVSNLLKKCIKAEMEARHEAQSLKCKVTTDKRGRQDGDLAPVSWPNQEECCLCRMPLALSKMSKYDQPRKQMCIAHGTQYMRILNERAEADRPEQPPVLTLHYTNQELIEVLDTINVYNMTID